MEGIYPKTIGTGVSAGQRPPYHLIFVRGPLEHALGPLDVEKDVGKDPDSILVSTHHQICKTDIIVCGNLALGHTRIHALWKEAEAAAMTLKTNSSQVGSENCWGLVSAEVEALRAPCRGPELPGGILALKSEALSADRTTY